MVMSFLRLSPTIIADTIQDGSRRDNTARGLLQERKRNGNDRQYLSNSQKSEHLLIFYRAGIAFLKMQDRVSKKNKTERDQ